MGNEILCQSIASPGPKPPTARSLLSRELGKGRGANPQGELGGFRGNSRGWEWERRGLGDVQELRFPPPGLPAVRNHAKVSHFRICKSPGGSLYIQKGHPFPDMEELLAFYTENWKVIQSPLLQPCSPTVRTGSCRCHPPPSPDLFSPFG